MKYFIDTEFIEGWKKPISWLPTIGNFNKKYHSVQLISVGIVSEDGREYYAVSNEFNPRDASEWVKDNVLHGIEVEMFQQLSPTEKSYRDPGFSYLLSRFGKSNNKIAEEIFNFINPDLGFTTNAYNNSDLKHKGKLCIHFGKHNVKVFEGYFYAQPEFYAYYADYDWVVFCSLFGTMMDLPKGFPMYCKDLKQMLDEKALASSPVNDLINKVFYDSGKHIVLNLKNGIKELKNHKDYPQQENEHNALDDAKWNKRLFDFLKKI